MKLEFIQMVQARDFCLKVLMIFRTKHNHQNAAATEQKVPDITLFYRAQRLPKIKQEYSSSTPNC